LRPSILGYRRCSRSNQDLTFIILPKRTFNLHPNENYGDEKVTGIVKAIDKVTQAYKK